MLSKLRNVLPFRRLQQVRTLVLKDLDKYDSKDAEKE
jgi:hypothetical protein